MIIMSSLHFTSEIISFCTIVLTFIVAERYISKKCRGFGSGEGSSSFAQDFDFNSESCQLMVIKSQEVAVQTPQKI